MLRNLAILGSTGSVGAQAIELVKKNRDRFNVVGLAAFGSRLTLLAQQVFDLAPEIVALAKTEHEASFKEHLKLELETRNVKTSEFKLPTIISGPGAVELVASYAADVILNGITGASGLSSTISALKAGRTLALANKESLIVGGKLVMEMARPGQLVPVDSEHSAIAQALRSGARSEVRRLIITANGGPFRGRPRSELGEVTIQEALNHPKWSMGPVITINSATLVNKALEVIEAHLLYDVPFHNIEVMVHPQSVIHSMVEFYDGATIAQASPPDMTLPISLGLAWPDRVPNAAPGIDWRESHTWEFSPLDNEAFPAVELAKQVGNEGGSAPAAYNGANEVCVDAFLAGRLPFLSIVDTVTKVVSEHNGRGDTTLDAILAADQWARLRAKEICCL